jgi:folate-binding protein YgfZ
MNESSPLPSGAIALTHLGVIRVEGEDAAKFIHGQLTQDFSLLDLGEARLAAFCSAKGRMLATFIGFKRSPTDILLICNRDILPATLKRLSMFVMRAKAKLTDASDAFVLQGVSGGSTNAPWQVHQDGAMAEITLYPAVNVARIIRVAPADTPLPDATSITAEQWAWGEVASGVAMISLPVVDAFVPQMLNYESVGGVSFKKGCYPGQEVVARSQFRGTLKRRAYLAHCAVAMQPGDEVFTGGDAGQPSGIVAQAAVSPDGGFDAIVAMQISAFEAGHVHLGAATGVLLQLAPPPYPLLADI